MKPTFWLISVWMAVTCSWAASRKSPCGDSASLSALVSQSEIPLLVQEIACRQNAWESAPTSNPKDLESSLDSLAKRLPQAPGYWLPKILAWSSSPALLPKQANALARLLGDLPELGAKPWREVAENRLDLRDTLSSGLFALRATAADSQNMGYTQARLNALLSLGPQNEETKQGPALRERQARLDSAIVFWSQPWPWHNPGSYQALESALWSTQRPEMAVTLLRFRLNMQGRPKHFASWFKAARQLHLGGHHSLAIAVMGSADFPVQDKDWQQALPLLLRLALMTDKTSLAAQWAEKALDLNRSIHSHWQTEWRLKAAEVCLREGKHVAAQAWISHAWPADQAEARELVQARILLAQDKPAEASILLSRLKNASRQNLSNGVVLKAQGTVALWQHHVAEAESLLALASGYVEDPEVQGVLEMRRWILLDTSMAVTYLLQGQPESPRPPEKKSAALMAIDSRSPLWAEGQWSLAAWHLTHGKTQEAIACYRNLTQAKTHARSQAAKARLIYLTESENAGQAIAAYEDLLVESQQGVPAEFARERLRLLGP